MQSIIYFHDINSSIYMTIGFQFSILEELCQKCRSMKEYEKWCTIIFDEVKIKEDIVYDKNSGSIVGFVHPLDITSPDVIPAPKPATHILTVMVKSICGQGSLETPIAHFASRTCKAENLYDIVWEAIKILEGLGMKVLAIVCDGSTANRRFLHFTKKMIAYTRPKISTPTLTDQYFSFPMYHI